MLKCCFVITEVVNPKDAKEAARRLVESGVCQYSVCVYVCVLCVCVGVCMFTMVSICTCREL